MSSACQFPKDERFRKLASKLADAVTVALWSGRKPKPAFDDAGLFLGPFRLCPFGCLTGTNSCAPFPHEGAALLGCEQEEAFQFMESFDRGIDRGTPWSALGLAYRERFK